METVLGHIREGTLDPNAEVIHFLLQGSDVLTHLIQYMDHSDKFDISEPVAALESICPSPRNHPDVHSASPDTPFDNGEDPVPETSSDSEIRSPETGHDENPVVVAARNGTPLFILEKADFLAIEKENNLVYLIEKPMETDEALKETHPDKTISEIKKYGTLLEHRIETNYSPLSGDGSPGPFTLLLFTSVLTKEDIQIVFSLDDRWVHRVAETGELSSTDTRETRLPSFSEPDGSHRDPTRLTAVDPIKTDPIQTDMPETDSSVVKPEPFSEKNKTEQHISSDTPMMQSRIRVDLELLDNLMSLAGEMVLSRNQLLQAIATQDFQSIHRVGQRINSVTSELQETVMLTRMQPMGKVFDRFPRVVRDLSAALEKKFNWSSKAGGSNWTKVCWKR